MLFNSFVYILLFLPIVSILYFYLIKQRYIVMSKVLLVLASLFFYNWYNPKYIYILVFSILFNYIIGNSFNRYNIKRDTLKKSLLIFGITTNLLILGYYKYMDFFIQNLNNIFHTNIHLFKILLPLGISFFTFQQITYLIDCYREKTTEYKFLDYALFVSFFPQLIAGPIVHHKEMMPQFKSLRTKILQHKNIILGLFIFIIGLFKKVILADTYANYVNFGFNSEHITILEAWLSSLSYTLQIYFDFSGYCDMATGSALMFNIKLPINFNSPYKSQSIQEFWSRWHITLSRFLKEYVYFSLGGSKKGEKRTYINILITFFISGFWHGAHWTFIFWGFFHGIGICINRLFKSFNISLKKWINILITFITINFLWVIFRAKNFSQARNILFTMFDTSNFTIPKTFGLTFKFSENISYENIILFLPLGLILIFASINSNQILSRIKLDTKKKAVILSIIFSILFLACILKIVIVPYSEFIYFNF